MSRLTASMIEELDALRETNDALQGPSFILRRHWHESNYRSLVRQGLVHWGEPPKGFEPRRFAGIQITIAGRITLDAALTARRENAA